MYRSPYRIRSQRKRIDTIMNLVTVKIALLKY